MPFFVMLLMNHSYIFIRAICVCCSQVALVQWTESVGLTLVNRDLTSLQLKTPSGQILSFYILQIFPFTSESKRMGIIVRVWALCMTILYVDAAVCVVFLLLSVSGSLRWSSHSFVFLI